MKAFLRIVVLLAILQTSVSATSMLADPQRKDLCGYWLGLNGDIPVVLELRLNGPSYISTLSKDGAPVTYACSWFTMGRKLRFEVEKSDSAFPYLAIDGYMTAPAASWERITLALTGEIIADGKCSLELKPLSKAEMSIGLVLTSMENAKKKASQMQVPTPVLRPGEAPR